MYFRSHSTARTERFDSGSEFSDATLNFTDKRTKQTQFRPRQRCWDGDLQENAGDVVVFGIGAKSPSNKARDPVPNITRREWLQR